jgi:mannose-6-phosphate isomerase-like protein (cupin superfamily)
MGGDILRWETNVDTTAVPAPFQTFSVQPQPLTRGKTSTRLVRTDHLNSGVQVVAEGGETNLHAHSSQDEIWFVVEGEAAFYTEGDTLVARLGKHQGLLIPHGAAYRFESVSTENLVILRFGAAVPEAGPDRRIDVQERKWAVSGEAGGIPREVEYRSSSTAG